MLAGKLLGPNATGVGVKVGARVSVGGGGKVAVGGKGVAVGTCVGGIWTGAVAVGAAPRLGDIQLQALVNRSAIKASRFIIFWVSKNVQIVMSAVRAVIIPQIPEFANSCLRFKRKNL
jgi:hypothetical protein